MRIAPVTTVWSFRNSQSASPDIQLNKSNVAGSDNFRNDFSLGDMQFGRISVIVYTFMLTYLCIVNYII
mgnify:FL=1